MITEEKTQEIPEVDDEEDSEDDDEIVLFVD